MGHGQGGTAASAEARRLLPRLVDRIAREGGRVDVTGRGVPTVSVVRTEDLERDETAPLDIAEAAKVELLVEPAPSARENAAQADGRGPVRRSVRQGQGKASGLGSEVPVAAAQRRSG
jgi:hypothetical protein